MVIKAKRERKRKKTRLPKKVAEEFHRTVFGLDKSKPTPFSAENIPEAVNLKTKLTINWRKILFRFTNIRFEIIEDKKHPSKSANEN